MHKLYWSDFKGIGCILEVLHGRFVPLLTGLEEAISHWSGKIQAACEASQC